MNDLSCPNIILGSGNKVVDKLCNVPILTRLFPIAQMVKNLNAMQETRIWSLGQENLLEKGRTIHSSILAWRIPWTEKPGGLQSVGSQRVGHDWSDLAHSMHQEDFTTSPEGRKELSFFYGILWITAGMDTLNSIDLAEISTFLFSAFRDLECLDLN